MRRLLCLVLCLIILPVAGFAEEPADFFDRVEADSLGKIERTYDSPTLKYAVEEFAMDGEKCYLSRIWVQEPARQIRKATAEWEKNVMRPVFIAEKIPEAALIINGSGFVSPIYPGIPDSYPGVSSDYDYTPLGSLTVTDGEIFRNLEGVAYYGLALNEDGIQMYTGADNEEVLAASPRQTWSFYEECPMLRDNADLLPENWPFADRRAARTIIARLDRNNYLILNVTSEKKRGLSLRRAVEFFQENFAAEWVYNLDGGPSSALLCRAKGRKKPKTLAGGTVKVADIMAFTE